MNGGKIEIYGEHSNRGLDFHGLTFNVLDDSSIDQMEAVSKIGMRNGTTYVNLNDGKKLAINANLYTEGDGSSLTVRAAQGQSDQNGVLELNGYSGSPKQTFTGTVTVGESNRAAALKLNCEHENGTYAVNAGSRLMGSGSITGNGGVTLAAESSKICGSLDVNNVKAISGGTYGDQWNPVSATISGSFTAAGVQTIENGSLTIGADCSLTAEVSTTTGEGESAVTTTTTGIADAAFSIKANGNLRIAQDVSIAGLTVADGGTITLVSTRAGAPEIAVAGTPSYAGAVNVVLDFGGRNAPSGFELKLPAGLTEGSVTVSDTKSQRKWTAFSKDDGLYAVSNGGFWLRLK